MSTATAGISHYVNKGGFIMSFTELKLAYNRAIDNHEIPSCCSLAEFAEMMDDDEEEYEHTSSTHGDYSPSNPWDAPGMSISDFL